jgi:hypothetical protein
LDAMLCGFFRLTKLPVATTFWRYVDSLGINQANAFLNILSALRDRVWQLCEIEYYRIRISIDTTVETIFWQPAGRPQRTRKKRVKSLDLTNNIDKNKDDKRKDLIPQIPSRYSDRGLRIDENKDMGKDEIEAYLSRDFYESAAFDLLSFLETKSPST